MNSIRVGVIGLGVVSGFYYCCFYPPKFSEFFFETLRYPILIIGVVFIILSIWCIIEGIRIKRKYHFRR